MVRTLSADRARNYYERHALIQDRQGWYEDAALQRLLAGGGFADAASVLEIGCGTGRLAAVLRARHLAPEARYVGLDIARAMLDLAAPRVAPERGASALLVQADVTRQLPFSDGSFDRVIAAYVLDLLSEEDARRLITEAMRVLRPKGRLCLASLARRTPRGLPRLVAWAWAVLQRLAPGRVGGCRPVDVAALVADGGWEIDAHDMVAPFSVGSEVVIAVRR